LDYIFSPLDYFGPAVAIVGVALFTVVLIKILSRLIKTKRYLELQEDFKRWYNLRQEALKCPDPEKAKLLAKNIDKAKLNKVYYDYFFEGLMLGLVSKYLPFFAMLAYVNETYKPDNLLKKFGQAYVYKLEGFGEKPLLVGSVFWFVIAVFAIFLLWYILKKISRRGKKPADFKPPKGSF
jgi:hypothetical protein